MNDTQPKPTSEWTVSTIDEWISLNPSTWRSVIAFEHKAALCEAKAAGWISQEALDEYAKVEAEHRELQQQLAAERDKANVRETELICERDYFKKELAAERDKMQTLVDALKNVRKDNDELWTDVTTEWRAKLHHNIRVKCDASLAKEGK